MKKDLFDWTYMPKKTYKNFLSDQITDYIGKVKIGDIETEIVYDECIGTLLLTPYFGTLKEKREYDYSHEKDGLDYGMADGSEIRKEDLPAKYKSFKKLINAQIQRIIQNEHLEEYAYHPTGFWEKKRELAIKAIDSREKWR